MVLAWPTKSRRRRDSSASTPIKVRHIDGSVAVWLYTPSGALQTGVTNSATSFNLSSVTLATTGTYTITINPQTTATGSLNLQVTSP